MFFVQLGHWVLRGWVGGSKCWWTTCFADKLLEQLNFSNRFFAIATTHNHEISHVQHVVVQEMDYIP